MRLGWRWGLFVDEALAVGACQARPGRIWARAAGPGLCGVSAWAVGDGGGDWEGWDVCERWGPG